MRAKINEELQIYYFMGNSSGRLFVVRSQQSTTTGHRQQLAKELAVLEQQVELARMASESASGHLQQLTELSPSPEVEAITHQQSQIAFHLKSLSVVLSQPVLQQLLHEGKTAIEESGPF